eukprot:763117-Hanusia_phi.AAC.4
MFGVFALEGIIQLNTPTRYQEIVDSLMCADCECMRFYSAFVVRKRNTDLSITGKQASYFQNIAIQFTFMPGVKMYGPSASPFSEAFDRLKNNIARKQISFAQRCLTGNFTKKKRELRVVTDTIIVEDPTVSDMHPASKHKTFLEQAMGSEAFSTAIQQLLAERAVDVLISPELPIL